VAFKPDVSALYKQQKHTQNVQSVGRRRALGLLFGASGSAIVAHASTSGVLPTVSLGQFDISDPPLASVLDLNVMEDGWRVTGRFLGLAPGGIAPRAGWSDLPQLTRLTIRGPGWDALGNFSVSRERVISLNDGVDRMWQKGVSEPRSIDTSPYVLDAAAGDLTFEVASTAYIYGMEVVSLSAVQGWFAGALAVGDTPVRNTSRLGYAKPMIDWVEPQREAVSGTFKVRLTGGFHLEGRNGRPLAAVKVTGTPWDPVANSPYFDRPRVTKLAAYEWNGPVGECGRGSAVWAAEFSEADFPIPGLVKFDFEDCPWIGDASAQRATDIRPVINPRVASFSTVGDLTSVGRGIQPVITWVGNVPGQRHVYVAASDNAAGLRGDDSSAICQASFEAAKLRPFATFDSAWRALFTPAKGGAADSSGSVVWLSDGTHLLPPSGFAGAPTTRRATDVAITVSADPAASQVNCTLQSSGSVRYVLFAAVSGFSTSFVILKNITLRSSPMNVGMIASSSGVRSTYMYFDGCSLLNDSTRSEAFIGTGAVVSARATTFRSNNPNGFFYAANTTYMALHFHNCETNAILNANVIWGLNIPENCINKPFQLGASSNSYIRSDNLIAGYIHAPDWNAQTAQFLQDGTSANPTAMDWGISVAFCQSSFTGGKLMFLKAGELNNKNYRNLIVEAVTTSPAADSYLTDSTIGFNFHNDPKTVPRAAPGNDYDRCAVRNSDLSRMAVKGPLFWALNGNGVAKPASAHFLTGGRANRQGVAMHGLVVRSRHDNNAMHSIGLCSIWGKQDQEFRLSYVAEASGYRRPIRGFVPVPAALIGHGFDLSGAPLYLDGTDAPGAFRRG